MSSSWHGYGEGDSYDMLEVVRSCLRRIEGGGVRNVPEKRHALAVLVEHAPLRIRWSPEGDGWGRSPFNPRCWRAEGGGEFLPPDLVLPRDPSESSR